MLTAHTQSEGQCTGCCQKVSAQAVARPSTGPTVLAKHAAEIASITIPVSSEDHHSVFTS